MAKAVSDSTAAHIPPHFSTTPLRRLVTEGVQSRPTRSPEMFCSIPMVAQSTMLQAHQCQTDRDCFPILRETRRQQQAQYPDNPINIMCSPIRPTLLQVVSFM